jgi:hypothetical protein
MINDIELIESNELRENINSLYFKVADLVSKNVQYSTTKHFAEATKLLINRHLYNHVLGVGEPISICDYDCELIDDGFNIRIFIDYKVTSGYTPYQDLDKEITLKFRIDECTIRDIKLNQILC